MALSREDASLRPTQNFVSTIVWCRRRPAVLLREVAWRWVIGVPALLFLWHVAQGIDATVPWRATGIAQMSVNQLLTDPAKASNTIAEFLLLVGPPLIAALEWPLVAAFALWTVVAAFGRTMVLRAMDEGLKSRTGTLIVLNVLRLVPLLGTVAVWRWLLSAVAQRTILQTTDPQVMAYVGSAIVLTLGLFVGWAAVGWVFAAAPLLSMRHGCGAFASLGMALRLKRSRNGLIEINMVLTIVKIMLIVLLMALSSTPLPFQSSLTDNFIFDWTVAMCVLYFVASDFFHVTRLKGYLRQWEIVGE